MNWQRGFSRISYAILAIGCGIGVAGAIFGASDGKAGGIIVGTLVFAGCWIAFHRAVAWIARGFLS